MASPPSTALSRTPPGTVGQPESSGWTRKVLAAGSSSAAAIRARFDSWANALTGLNTSRDKSAYTLPYVEALLTPQMLEVLYHTDDIASRIVTAIPDECFREPWQIVSTALVDKAEEMRKAGAPLRERLDAINRLATESDAHERAAELEGDFKRHGVRQKLREALSWGRLYGLGAVLVGADDGLPPDEPLDWTRVRSVDFLTTLDKRDLVPWYWYADVQAPQFGDVAVYQVQPVGVFIGGMPYSPASRNEIITVHESRLVRFGGELTSKRERLRNQGADYSVLQKCFRALQLTNNNWQSASALLTDASQGVIKVKGLIDMISAQPDVMTARMQIADQMRSVLRALILDADGEDFKREPTPFTGIPEMLDKTWERLASAARMPKSILMGTAPGSLNATGAMDLRWWYDTIASTQRETVLPNVERLLRLFATARGYPDAEQWTVKFSPLWQMTRPEQADYQLKSAQRDQIYIAEGVLLAEEIALSRFGSGSWSDEIQIDVDTRKAILSARLAKEEAAATAPPPPTLGKPPMPGAPPAPGMPVDPASPDAEAPPAVAGTPDDGAATAGTAAPMQPSPTAAPVSTVERPTPGARGALQPSPEEAAPDSPDPRPPGARTDAKTTALALVEQRLEQRRRASMSQWPGAGPRQDAWLAQPRDEAWRWQGTDDARSSMAGHIASHLGVVGVRSVAEGPTVKVHVGGRIDVGERGERSYSEDVPVGVRDSVEAHLQNHPLRSVATWARATAGQRTDEQERVPKGQPGGGEFGKGGGGTSSAASPEAKPAKAAKPVETKQSSPLKAGAGYSPVATTPVPKKEDGKPAAGAGAQLPPELLERLKALGVGKLPAAHIAEVHVHERASDTDAHKGALLKWKDDKGKVQSAYTKSFDEANAQKKWARVEKNRPKVERAMRDLGAKAQDSPAHAAALVIANTGLRPGSDDSLKATGHYGVTTMEARHVSFTPDGNAQINYVGKAGKDNKATISDPQTVAALRAHTVGKAPTDRVFTAPREAVAAAAPKGVKLKDLRTIMAAQTAERALARTKFTPTGNDKKDARQILAVVKQVSTGVSTVLNNTPAMAKKSYIPPAVFQAWGRKNGVKEEWLK